MELIRLVIDTSTKNVTFGIFKGEWTKTWTFPDDSYQQSKVLVNLIKKSLAEIELTPKEVDEIAVGIGPGSYTGLRVGLTVAKTWSFSMEIPLFSFDSSRLFEEKNPLPQLRKLDLNDFKEQKQIDQLEPVYEGDHFANQ